MNNVEKIPAILDSRMEAVESGQTALDKRVLQPETVQAAFDGRLEWTDREIRNMNRRMDDPNLTQAAIERRMGRFEAPLFAPQTEISALSADAAELRQA